MRGYGTKLVWNSVISTLKAPSNQSYSGRDKIHGIKLVVNAREDLSDVRRVTDHAGCAHDRNKITARHNSRWLVIETTFESCEMVRLVLMVATEAFTSLGTISQW